MDNSDEYTSDSQKRIWLLSGGYALCFLILLFAAYTNRLPLAWLSQLPNYDKLGHVILYCIPTYLGHRLCRQKHVKQLGLSLPVFPFFFTLFTLAEELAQRFAPHRTLDAGDLVCSSVGIVCGYCLAQWPQWRKAERSEN